MSGALPTGTVTFVLTDVEGSSRLWETDPAAMRSALSRHDELIEETVAEHGGSVVKPRGEGDSRFAVFPRAADGAAAALAIQLRLAAERWGTSSAVRVRIALHTGEADLREADYYGTAVNRCARLRDVAHGGQVLLSEVTAELVAQGLPEGASLLDLGSHQLKDLSTPEHVFQLAHPDLPRLFPPLESLNARPNNLPARLTSFIGREKEIAEVGTLVAAGRDVTLTGSGGVGKTRLAYQVAAEVMDEFPGGVWVSELASVSGGGLVPQTVATSMGLREEPGRTILETLVDYLKGRRALIVLDNCEHLLEGCRELVRRVLERCEGVRVLSTSREPLGVPGEVLYPVPSMPVPHEESDRSLEAIAFVESVRLFVERATQSKPAFQLNNDNVLGVASICRRLDGIPLAIELAAARVRHLTPNEIAERLDDRFRILTGGNPAALGRHQTLRAAIDWSHDMLTEQEKVLFRRASTFAGGFTLEAAEEVCGEDLE